MDLGIAPTDFFFFYLRRLQMLHFEMAQLLAMAMEKKLKERYGMWNIRQIQMTVHTSRIPTG